MLVAYPISEVLATQIPADEEPLWNSSVYATIIIIIIICLGVESAEEG